VPSKKYGCDNVGIYFYYEGTVQPQEDRGVNFNFVLELIGPAPTIAQNSMVSEPSTM
jgi:hypothetical protein